MSAKIKRKNSYINDVRLTKYRPLSAMAAVQQNHIFVPANILQHIVRFSIHRT